MDLARVKTRNQISQLTNPHFIFSLSISKIKNKPAAGDNLLTKAHRIFHWLGENHRQLWWQLNHHKYLLAIPILDISFSNDSWIWHICLLSSHTSWAQDIWQVNGMEGDNDDEMMNMNEEELRGASGWWNVVFASQLERPTGWVKWMASRDTNSNQLSITSLRLRWPIFSLSFSSNLLRFELGKPSRMLLEFMSDFNKWFKWEK